MAHSFPVPPGPPAQQPVPGTWLELDLVTGAHGRRWLNGTRFACPTLTARGRPFLRAYRGSNGFPWGRGMMALTHFFLRYAAWGLRRRSDPAAPEPVCVGRAGEVAATVEHLLNQL